MENLQNSENTEQSSGVGNQEKWIEVFQIFYTGIFFLALPACVIALAFLSDSPNQDKKTLEVVMIVALTAFPPSLLLALIALFRQKSISGLRKFFVSLPIILLITMAVTLTIYVGHEEEKSTKILTEQRRYQSELQPSFDEIANAIPSMPIKCAGDCTGSLYIRLTANDAFKTDPMLVLEKYFLQISEKRNFFYPNSGPQDFSVESTGESIKVKCDLVTCTQYYHWKDSSKTPVTTVSPTISQYTNNDYKLSFSYPSSWDTNDTGLGRGAFQLFNYDYKNAPGKEGFPKGQNKIEVVIIDDPKSFYSTGVTTETTVAGQKAYINKGEYYSYAIVIPSTPGKYLAITIYGDKANFSALDDLLKTLTWQ